MARNLGDNQELGGYAKMLPERDLEWQAMKQSLLDFFFALQTRTFYMLRQMYQRKLIPSSVYLPFWNTESH